MKKYIIVGLSIVLLSGLAGCSRTTGDSSNPETNTQKSTQMESRATKPAVKVSVNEAIKAYQKTYPESDITSIDLDTSFGKYLYSIEGVDDSKEYEVQVDAETMEVSKEREESLDREEQNGVKRKEDKLDLDSLLSVEEISAIAEKEVGKGKAIDWSLDQEMGTTYWEVKVAEGDKETEVTINAKSGEVLETEIDD